MYPVQVMISYFTTSFTVIMHIGREVTAKQYTGGGLQDSKGTYIKKQAQEWEAAEKVSIYFINRYRCHT
ncbi:hypothetical protein, partial [Mitsuokella multacida]|uniref:hypothetical protein n=1 Tax=Mitsuokella multacida TaxID=52226 RepID=UPI0024304E47